MSEKCGFCEEAALVYYVNSGYVWGIRCGISVWPRDLTLWMLNYEPCGGVILSKKASTQRDNEGDATRVL